MNLHWTLTQTILGYLGLGVMILSHEYGHYYVAKKEGIYNGWTWFPSIKLKRVYDSRWDYLSGLWGSLISFPIFALIGYEGLISFPFFAIGISVLDIFICVMYKTEWLEEVNTK